MGGGVEGGGGVADIKFTSESKKPKEAEMPAGISF